LGCVDVELPCHGFEYCKQLGRIGSVGWHNPAQRVDSAQPVDPEMVGRFQASNDEIAPKEGLVLGAWRGAKHAGQNCRYRGMCRSSHAIHLCGDRRRESCRIKFARKEKLVRPSVQLPAGIHGWRGL